MSGSWFAPAGSSSAGSSGSCICFTERLHNLAVYGQFVPNADLDAALKPDADKARQDMHDRGVLINGVPSDEALKGKSNQQVVDEYNKFLNAQRRGAVPLLPTPRGMSFSDFGSKVMKWGTGDAAARERMKGLTQEELQKSGVTQDMAKEWRDFYKKEALRNPNNPSAQGRAELMQRAYELLGGK